MLGLAVVGSNYVAIPYVCPFRDDDEFLTEALQLVDRGEKRAS